MVVVVYGVRNKVKGRTAMSCGRMMCKSLVMSVHTFILRLFPTLISSEGIQRSQIRKTYSLCRSCRG